MTFRERVEESPVFWLLSALFAGFLAGLGTYESILRIAHLEVISKAEAANLRKTAEPRGGGLTAWKGFWKTDTETYKNLRIHFTESSEGLVGTYRVPRQTSGISDGRIEARVNGVTLVGTWVERQGNKDISGEIHFVLFDEGKSFLGSYTREWEGAYESHVWTGRKD